MMMNMLSHTRPLVTALSACLAALATSPCPAAAEARAGVGIMMSTGPEQGQPRERAAQLIDLLNDYMDWDAQTNPVSASQRGDLRYNDELPDNSRQGIEAIRRETQQFLRRLEAIERLDSGSFSEMDRIDAALLRWELELALKEGAFKPEQIPVDTRWGPQLWLPQMHERLPMSKPKHRADYAARLEAIPRYIDNVISHMRAGMEAGRVPPRVVVEGADRQCFALASERIQDDPRQSPFFTPLRGLAEGNPNALRALRAIAEGVTPAFEKLGTFLRDEYIPACRESIGASDGIDGRPLYELALRRFTTTELSADEIHLTGIDEVGRIRAEMMEVIKRTDWWTSRDDARAEDSDDEVFAQFIEYLRTDPRFYHETPEDLLTGYRDICKRMDAHLPELFITLPRLPYGVKPMSGLMGPSSPTAYYYGGSIENGVPGYFVANTYRLEQRPKYEMVALALHEAVPGHHLQIALAQELEGVHEFRRQLGFSVFVEGWALYSERLGLEVGPGERGLYSDPYDDFGRLTYEMWRACRLVVDTGIHAKGWTREEAVQYMLDNTALSEVNVNAEVNRYIGWPGQACAYKIGELRIRALRTEAEEELGAGPGGRFDIRAFHEVVLGAGAVPLSVLERRMRSWIEETGAAGP